jgi:4-hydroxybenzoate polyprenyltransferase
VTDTVASRPRIYLSLGRVSNLPTVWTNTLAGVTLGGGARDAPTMALLATALSVFYVGGMFLNDAFDRAIDAEQRPERPIPSGRISAFEVFSLGFAMLGAGLGLLVWNAALTGGTRTNAVGSGVALAALVVLYDAWHKQNPLSPIVMGACRSAVYVTAALGSGGKLGPALVAGALVAGAYVVGLTFVARQENRQSFRAGGTLALLASPIAVALLGPSIGVVACVALIIFAGWAGGTVRSLFGESPNVPRSVVRLIAGISLVDTLLMAAYGAPELAIVGVLGFGATLGLQRWVRGT